MMTVRDTWLALKQSNELKSDGQDFVENTVSAIFGDPVAAVKALGFLFKSPVLIQSYIFWEKFSMYLDDILTDDEEIRKLSAVFADNDEREEYARRVISTVDKIETRQKVRFIINLTRSLTNQFICKSDYYRFLWCIANTSYEDLRYLSDNIGRREIADNIHLRFLEMNGLATKENTPLFSEEEVSKDELYFKYTFTTQAEWLDKYSLNYGKEHYHYVTGQAPLENEKLHIPAGTSFGTLIPTERGDH